MKKFTFITMLMLLVGTMAKAELMDKAFYKMKRFATVQDATVTATEKGTNPITVKSNKNNNTPRYLYTVWGEDAYVKCPAELPETGYTFSTEFAITADAGVSNCMELVLAPENTGFKLTHMRLFNKNEYFFRMHQAANKNEEGLCEVYINGDVEEDADWNFGEKVGKQVFMTPGVNYSIRVTVSKDGSKSSYVIKEIESGNVLAEGEKDITALENKHIGMIWFNTGGGCTYDFNDMKLSTLQDGPFSSEPSAELLAVIGKQRAYYVNFSEGETLHWKQLGDAEDAVTGEALANGEEYTVEYGDANDTRDFEANSEEYVGTKIIYCTESGELKVWTSLADNEENTSDEVIVNVECVEIAMPNPVATITNVSEGYSKEYTISADNSETLLNPTVTIKCIVKDASGNKVTEKDIMSGEKVTFEDAGSLELYAYDGTHPTPWYTQSETVSVNNNVEYVKQNFTNYAWTKAECDETKAGYTVTEIVDNANKSHWDRIYSDQKYGYDENGNASAWADGTEYAYVKEGFNFYPGTVIGTDDAKWNVQVPEDIYTGFSPIVPATAENYEEGAWAIFPLEGIVYYAINITNLTVGIDSKYVSDDASKPNFYIVHTRGGYDRPDKGDCNATTVCVAGENYSLYRYDTAICDVTVMTYKGFTPGETGISTVNAAETAAPVVKKVVTDKGIVIVKGDKAYSVSGAQIK